MPESNTAPEPDMTPPPELAPIVVVGVIGGETFGHRARQAIAIADVVVGSPRHLEAVPIPETAHRIELTGPLDEVLARIEQRAMVGERVCVLASGDPGFFGIVRSLRAVVGSHRLTVLPAPSSVSLAFATLGLSWDDALVVSAHGRPLEAAICAAEGAPLVAFLAGPDAPPQRIAAALVEAGCGPRSVSVVSNIGDATTTAHGDLATIAAGSYHPMSVMVVRVPDYDADHAGLSWGRPEAAFSHRGGMITKAETRAIALGKLALPPTGVLWDVGAGSGSVGIECASLRPGLAVFAIEQHDEDAARVSANATAHGAAINVITGTAPDALAALPDPDRVFIGGGGPEVLDVVLKRLRPGGVVVANFTVLDRAVSAWHQLGNMVEVSVNRGVAIGELGVRLAAENPVFICWGPEPHTH